MLLKVIGLHNMHVRSDRDDHVYVLHENIDPEYSSDFDKLDIVEGTPFNFASFASLMSLSWNCEYCMSYERRNLLNLTAN